jgi:hypothetical protein
MSPPLFGLIVNQPAGLELAKNHPLLAKEGREDYVWD